MINKLKGLYKFYKSLQSNKQKYIYLLNMGIFAHNFLFFPTKNPGKNLGFLLNLNSTYTTDTYMRFCALRANTTRPATKAKRV